MTEARATRQERGYGAEHEALRADYQRRMNQGQAFDCWRCHDPIDPEHWHLGHDDHDRTVYHGPECVPCNTATSGRKQRRKPPQHPSGMDAAARVAQQRDAARRQRASRVGHVTLVCGPPASGKTTYVAEHKRPGDVVIDFDVLAVALGSDDSHDHPASLRPFIHAARNAAIEQIATQPVRVWLIACEPTERDRRLARTTVEMETQRDECKRRAAAAARPASWSAQIDAWFDRRNPAL